MKKVLALVLAVLMMATVAFAATAKPTLTKSGNKYVGTVSVNYGDKAAIDSGVLKAAGIDADKVKYVTSENYSITSVKYNEGKNLIKSVDFNDDDNQVEVKLKSNYANTTEKSFEVEFTLKGKKVGKAAKPADVNLVIKGAVKNDLDETTLKITQAAADGGEDTIELEDADENKIYKVKLEGTEKYATLELTAADKDFEIEGRVFDGDKYYLYSECDADKDVLKAYADTDADITFLTFTGTPTFNATMTVRIYKDEGLYFYANNDGKLVDITGKRAAGSAMDLTSKVNWDADEGCYILKTRTLGAYVMSDKPLKATTTADNVGATTNPDTGANDVVGIATALAAVALVSAAAVSLKK